MKHLILICSPKKRSLSHVISDMCLDCLSSTNTSVRDLCDPVFDPVMTCEELLSNTSFDDVLDEQALISSVDVIIIIHPVWWFGPPAVLKGWYDRVLVPGFAFDYKEDTKIGKLSDKHIVYFQTAASTLSTGRSSVNVQFNDVLWHFCGVKTVHQEVFLIRGGVDLSLIRQKVRRTLSEFCTSTEINDTTT